jgi:hypothetical protein
MKSDIFVRDMLTGTTELVSVNANGGSGNSRRHLTAEAQSSRGGHAERA